MPTVTKDNVREYQGYIDTLYNGLKGVRDGAFSAGVMGTLKSNFEQCAPSDWGDDVGSAYKSRIEKCVSYMDTMGQYCDSQLNVMVTCVYDMDEYADEVVALLDRRSELARWRSNLNKEAEDYKKKYDNYTNNINNCDHHIDENLRLLNAEIAKLPGFHFELSESSSSGDDGGGDSGGETQSPKSNNLEPYGDTGLYMETYTDPQGHVWTVLVDPATGRMAMTDGSQWQISTLVTESNGRQYVVTNYETGSLQDMAASLHDYNPDNGRAIYVPCDMAYNDSNSGDYGYRFVISCGGQATTVGVAATPGTHNAGTNYLGTGAGGVQLSVSSASGEN